MWRFRDVYPGSRIRIFPSRIRIFPSRIPDQKDSGSQIRIHIKEEPNHTTARKHVPRYIIQHSLETSFRQAGRSNTFAAFTLGWTLTWLASWRRHSRRRWAARKHSPERQSCGPGRWAPASVSPSCKNYDSCQKKKNMWFTQRPPVNKKWMQQYCGSGSGIQFCWPRDPDPESGIGFCPDPGSNPYFLRA